VIRVTSSAPVQQPLVSFLVEVDWGQGRLVREYSALLDTPRTVSAPAQPPIQAPVAAPPNVVEQPVAARPAAPPPEPQPVPEVPAPEPAAAPEPEPEPVVAAPAPAPAAPLADPGQLQVRQGDTLSELAAGLAAGRDYTLDQTMLALLRANPEAFIDGNLNLLRSGVVLRVPDAAAVAGFSRAEATAVVRDHVERWQASREPAPQPAAVADAGDTAAAAPDAGNAQVAGARLEIVPPSGDGTSPGTRSGTSAGGEGDMLRQEMQAKEDLAARTAEVDELRARIAELEKLQQQQQQLIRMKDSELAAAQQRLAQAREGATAVPAGQEQPTTSATPWLWGGVGLLVLGALAWLVARRRRPEPVARRGFDTAALAAGMPTAAPSTLGEDLFGDAAGLVDEVEPADEPVTPPQWPPAPVASAPTWHGGAAVGVAPAAAEAAAASQKLELARAYLDLGDDDSARALLRELLDSRDPVAREAAASLLRDL
jgi:pilus assembly protein FimV